MREPIKFFYDNYTDSDVAGIFSLPHILSIFLFLAAVLFLLRLSRGLDKKGVARVHFAVAVIISVLEIVKVGLRIYKNQSPDSWVPLYYCSLFIFAVWAALLPFSPIRRAGLAFITMGGCAAAVFFTIYPSTSFGMYPAWHPSVFHSFVYHLAMLYLGILLLTTKVYVPRARDGLGYFVFILLASVPAVILNSRLGTNCMFLRHAFKLPILDPLATSAPLAYMAVVFFAQAVLMFFGNYVIYLCIAKRKKENNK